MILHMVMLLLMMSQPNATSKRTLMTVRCLTQEEFVLMLIQYLCRQHLFWKFFVVVLFYVCAMQNAMVEIRGSSQLYTKHFDLLSHHNNVVSLVKQIQFVRQSAILFFIYSQTFLLHIQRQLLYMYMYISKSVRLRANEVLGSTSIEVTVDFLKKRESH